MGAGLTTTSRGRAWHVTTQVQVRTHDNVFIMGKPKHEINTSSRDQLSEHGGDDLTRALLFVVLQKLHLCARIRVEKTYSLSSSCIPL